MIGRIIWIFRDNILKNGNDIEGRMQFLAESAAGGDTLAGHQKTLQLFIVLVLFPP